MHISQVLHQNTPAISFEFFPPKTEKASEELFHSIQELVPLKPAYVSVTYGAGGTTRDLTHDLVVKLQQETSLTIVSHLTCVGSSQDEIFQILENYNTNGKHTAWRKIECEEKILSLIRFSGVSRKGSKPYTYKLHSFEFICLQPNFIEFVGPHESFFG